MPEALAPGSAVVLFGGGGHARAVVDVLTRLRVVVVATVAPDQPDGLSSDDEGIDHAREEGLAAVCAIGDNRRRLDLAHRLRDAGVGLPAIVAATATVADDARVGAGTIVMEHAHVGPAAVLGTACLVNTAAAVEHDCVLRGGVHCAPHSALTGSVRCGRRVLIGAGAVALPGTTVGDDAVVGAGSVLVEDVGARETVVGVPGRAAKLRSAP